jgi:hypothetical protein
MKIAIAGDWHADLVMLEHVDHQSIGPYSMRFTGRFVKVVGTSNCFF